MAGKLLSDSELTAVREAAEVERDVRDAGGEPCRTIAKRYKARSEWKYAAELADEAHAHRAALLSHVEALEKRDRWVPVTEGLPPNEVCEYDVTCQTAEGKLLVSVLCWLRDHWEMGYHVIAYRKRPEPYRPRSTP